MDTKYDIAYEFMIMKSESRKTDSTEVKKQISERKKKVWVIVTFHSQHRSISFGPSWMSKALLETFAPLLPLPLPS